MKERDRKVNTMQYVVLAETLDEAIKLAKEYVERPETSVWSGVARSNAVVFLTSGLTDPKESDKVLRSSKERPSGFSSVFIQKP